MALPILDGNQSATTLSTIISGGEHTPAHTVVSLGSTAISNITSAVSGSVVSISNFPATQTISGTVTANLGAIDQFALKDALDEYASNYNFPLPIRYANTHEGDPLPISGTVTAASDKGPVSEASTQSITTGGTHQQVFASNSSRKYLLIQNISDTDMYLGLGFNPSNTTPAGLLLAKSGGGIVFESSYIPTSEVRIVCATTGKRFVALQG